jgi:hypothetical protein
VPDFEIMIRLALLYGEHRVIFRPEVYMTARADRSSMTYRTEAYDQFVCDKLIVLDRYFCKSSANDLCNFLYKKALFGVYHWAARSLFSMAGGNDLAIKYAFMAEKIIPGAEGLKILADQGPTLRWERKARGLRQARDLSKYLNAGDKRFQDIKFSLWATGRWRVLKGAKVKKGFQAVNVYTSANAWNYALIIKIPISPHDLIDNLIWVELSLKSIKGVITVSMFNSRENTIYGETIIDEELNFKDYFLEYFSAECDSILIRNAGMSITGHLQIRYMRLVFVNKKITMES